MDDNSNKNVTMQADEREENEGQDKEHRKRTRER
jgi:hypothetical protein